MSLSPCYNWFCEIGVSLFHILLFQASSSCIECYFSTDYDSGNTQRYASLLFRKSALYLILILFQEMCTLPLI